MTSHATLTGARATARSPIAAAATALVLLMTMPAAAQQSTEQFIPIGRSPGLSGTQTYAGTIADVDAGARTVALGTGAARHDVRITPRTRIWIDRTQYGKANTAGRFEDLAPGRRVEVRYVDAAAKQAADWIKVAAEAGD